MIEQWFEQRTCGRGGVRLEADEDNFDEPDLVPVVSREWPCTKSPRGLLTFHAISR
jgi:hypothetical protein